jgi:hypothetical protein
VKDYRYIPAPDDVDDEAEHCMRMRRCGADALLSNVSMHVLQERLSASSQMHIMGWPSGGGVWVYRVPQSWYSGKSIEEQLASSPPYSHFRLDNPGVMLNKVRGELRGCEDMEQFCEVLERYGGDYYEDIMDCRAVVHLRLFDTKGSEKFISSIFSTLGDLNTRIQCSTTLYTGSPKAWDPNGSTEFLVSSET